jgi:hypothetical protein
MGIWISTEAGECLAAAVVLAGGVLRGGFV